MYEATGVAEALKTLDTVPAHAICSDFNMRGGTGIKLLERLRHEKIKIPFVLMSGDNDRRLVEITERYGATVITELDKKV